MTDVISFGAGFAEKEGFASRFAPEYRGSPKQGKAESRQRQSCIDVRGLGTR